MQTTPPEKRVKASPTLLTNAGVAVDIAADMLGAPSKPRQQRRRRHGLQLFTDG